MAAGILDELQDVVAEGVDAHDKMVRRRGTWSAADYIPYDLAEDYRSRPPRDSDSPFSPQLQVALETAALTEAALPWYTTALTVRFGASEAWMTWLREHWVPEEDRHAKALAEFITATRALPPARLETGRAAALSAGYTADGWEVIPAIAYVAVQELTTRVAHKNTAEAARGQDADAGALLARIAWEENTHAIFYRDVMTSAAELAPSAAMTAICREVSTFQMPGRGIVPDFESKARILADAGIYDWRIHHQKVIWPLVRHWRVFSRGDAGLDDDAKRRRDRLWVRMERLDARLAAAYSPEK